MDVSKHVYRALYLCTLVLIVRTSEVSDVLSTVEPLSRDSRDLACTNVRYAYQKRGFSNSDVPLKAISGKIHYFSFFLFLFSKDNFGNTKKNYINLLR